MINFFKFNIMTILYLPIFLYDLLLYKFLKKKNHNKSYQYLIRLYCLLGNFPNKLISFFLKEDKIKIQNKIFNRLYSNIKKEIKSIKKIGFFYKSQAIDSNTVNKIVKHLSLCEGKYESDNYKSLNFCRLNIRKPLATTFRYKSEQLLQSNEIQNLLINPEILKFCQEYLNACPIIDIVSSWWSFPSLNPDNYSAQMWHFDMDRPKWLKVFIFLTDCLENNGPHYFIKGTHNKIPLSIRFKGYERISEEMILKNFSTEDIKKFTAKKGSILIEDTSGLHKGENVIQNSRLILQFQYSSCLFGTNEIQKIKYPKNPTKNFIYAKNNYPKLFFNFE